MELLTFAQLRRLLEAETNPGVSIFMPTHCVGRDTRQDPARLKNLLRQVEERLATLGMRPTEAHALLEPAWLLVDDINFWQFNDQGLAIYVARSFFRAYKLPVEVDDSFFVNHRFEIKPLLPLLEGRLFYVLAISLNDARLLECTPHGCQRLALSPDVATSLQKAIGTERDIQSEVMKNEGGVRAPGPAAESLPGAGHGHVEAIQQKVNEDTRFFFRQLDDGVRRAMSDPDAFLVLAGVDKKVRFYRECTQLRNLAPEHIQGNFEHVDDGLLHDRAMAILDPIWHAELNRLQEHYGNASGKGLASNQIEEIVPAAASGRVGILFVSPRATYYGKFDERALAVQPSTADDPEAEDLVDRATVAALRTGAQVVVCEPDEVPGNRAVGAIYRY